MIETLSSSTVKQSFSASTLQSGREHLEVVINGGNGKSLKVIKRLGCNKRGDGLEKLHIFSYVLWYLFASHITEGMM